jgi:hypothetical protein
MSGHLPVEHLVRPAVFALASLLGVQGPGDPAVSALRVLLKAVRKISRWRGASQWVTLVCWRNRCNRRSRISPPR